MAKKKIKVETKRIENLTCPKCGASATISHDYDRFGILKKITATFCCSKAKRTYGSEKYEFV